MDRPTRACRLCGALIFWDHGFRKRNLYAHERACSSMDDVGRARVRKRVAMAAAKSRRPRRRRKSKKQLELDYGEDEKEKP